MGLGNFCGRTGGWTSEVGFGRWRKSLVVVIGISDVVTVGSNVPKGKTLTCSVLPCYLKWWLYLPIPLSMQFCPFTSSKNICIMHSCTLVD